MPERRHDERVGLYCKKGEILERSIPFETGKPNTTPDYRLSTINYHTPSACILHRRVYPPINKRNPR